jgi:exopolyphosphatase/guanosine-5'-triphosphate,3'-diphosphate pyrophosphatase
VNSDGFDRFHFRASGLKTEIISGAREAEWVFQGVTTDPELAGAVAAAGRRRRQHGIHRGRRGEKAFRAQLPLGTVRLMEKFPHGDPPTRGEFNACRDWLKIFCTPKSGRSSNPRCENESGEIRLVGTGGTTSILARIGAKLDRYDREKIERTVLRL